MPPTDPAYTDSMNRLIERFATLPGIGRRTAERLAFHVLKTDRDDAMALANAIRDVKANVRHCSRCYNLTESDPCPVCADPHRDARKILVVEQPRDVIQLEQTRSYDGTYHVLLGRLSPLEGVGVGEITLGPLIERVRHLAESGEEAGRDVEVILGTNPNLEGDGTALHIAEALRDLPNVSLTRLARGLPAGSELQFANKAVLSDAIASRQSVR